MAGDRHDWRQARASYEAQMAIATRISDRRGVIDALLGIAGIEGFGDDDYDAARKSAEQALELAKAINYMPGMREALILLGSVETDAYEAFRWRVRAGLVAQEIDDRESLHFALFTISIALLEHGQSLQALAGFVRAAQLDAEAGLSIGFSIAIFHAGLALHSCGRLLEAEFLFRTAIAVAREAGATRLLGPFFSDMGALLLDEGKADEALHSLTEASEAFASVEPWYVIDREDKLRRLALSTVRARFGLGKVDSTSAAEELGTLLPGADARLAADIVYWHWRIAGGSENRLAATMALHDAYAVHGHTRYRQRYFEITGDLLPEAPPLPDVSALIPVPTDLDRVLSRLGVLLPSLPSNPATA